MNLLLGRRCLLIPREVGTKPPVLVRKRHRPREVLGDNHRLVVSEVRRPSGAKAVRELFLFKGKYEERAATRLSGLLCEGDFVGLERGFSLGRFDLPEREDVPVVAVERLAPGLLPAPPKRPCLEFRECFEVGAETLELSLETTEPAGISAAHVFGHGWHGRREWTVPDDSRIGSWRRHKHLNCAEISSSLRGGSEVCAAA